MRPKRRKAQAVAVGLATALAVNWAVAQVSKWRREGGVRLARLESRWDKVWGMPRGR
jgi:hypothetical protein